MKRYLYILSLLLICQFAIAQDTQRFAERNTTGTARYVGMGGAMTAIGGDPSAAIVNPAGLGLYRRSEISATIDETIDITQQIGSNDTYQSIRFSAPQITAIWAWGNPKKQQGLVYNNFMFSYHRLANFNRDIVVKGGDMGMVPTICNITNDEGGVSEEYIVNLPWDNEQIGWLSILGYEGYLIDPAGDNIWQPAVNFTDGVLSISETGTSDQYTLSWAGNINNQWYIGIGLNVPTISYTKHTSLLEYNKGNSAELKSMFHVSGVGVSGSFGLIYRPIQALRVGASLQTPTVMNLSRQSTGDMYSTVAGQKYEILTPESGVMEVKIASPLRTSVSMAGQIGNIGLIAAQYDYAHSKEMEDIHTLRIGAEAQAYRGLFFNAGYIYESSFMREEEPKWLLGYNEIRTDMDYRYTAATQYASAGIGYRCDKVVAQLAYQYSWQTIHQYASEEQEFPFNVNTRTHRIVATLAWRF